MVLLRHGESLWNMQHRFTGWIDVDLSSKGINEARMAGMRMKKEGLRFDVAHTSLLKRANKTLTCVLDEMDLDWIAVCKHWRLNERHYGSLQGMNKEQTVQQYGEKQVLQWRRSFLEKPPLLDVDAKTSPKNDIRYQHMDIPMLASNEGIGESLKNVLERLLPYWEQTIRKQLLEGNNVLIVAHGNSLRSLVMHLDGLSKEQVLQLNIPTAAPLIYEFSDHSDQLNVQRTYYLK